MLDDSSTPALISRYEAGILAPHDKLLVAISGGSDSTALLHLLKAASSAHLSAATVDHGLRPEAMDEAQQVAKFCTKMGVDHKTLIWRPDATSANSARIARYGLLVKHAREIGATGIVLGHTSDDQAETLFMRLQRAKPHSGTRGFAAMTPETSYDGIKLLRPLLSASREELRTYLRRQNIVWIDDPSNENVSSERIRTRKHLNKPESRSVKSNLTRFASVAARSRFWLSQQCAAIIVSNSIAETDGSLKFQPPENLHRPLLVDIFTLFVLATGGQKYRVGEDKVTPIIHQLMSGETHKTTIGGCLIVKKHGTLHFQREERNIPPMPSPTAIARKKAIVWDNRWLIFTDGTAKPFVTALEQFRPSIDDPSYHALMTVLGKVNGFRISGIYRGELTH